MSKLTRIVFSVFLALSFFFSILISVLRYFALEEFETDVGYFAYGASLPSVVNYLLFSVVLIYFVAGLYLRGKISLSAPQQGITYYLGNALLGTSLAAYALFSFPAFFELHEKETLTFTSALLLLTTLLAVAGVFFCIHNCLFPDAAENKRLLFGLSVPLFAVAYVLYLYFETSMPINQPNKLLDQFTFIFIALYLLYELRILMKAPRYAAQCSLGMIAMVFTAVSGFPSFIYMLSTGTPLYENAAHDILMIAVFIYIAVRMLRILFSESASHDRILDLLNEAEHPAAALGRNATERDEELDEFQLTFDTIQSETEIEIIPENEETGVYEIVTAKSAENAPQSEDGANEAEATQEQSADAEDALTLLDDQEAASDDSDSNNE